MTDRIELPLDLVEEARAAGLVHVSDEDPGIRRRRCGRGFTYALPDGSTLRDPDQRERIDTLAIPPGWGDVWICLDAAGHLQATGRDDQDRKQYRYHERWDELRHAMKFRRLLVFGRRLPALRRRVGRDLAQEGLPRVRVLAAAVRILEQSGIRIGNPEYEARNGSYGLTTLRRRHVEPDGSTLSLEFQGKGGREVSLDVRDVALADAIREALELPGWRVLKYVNGDGKRNFVDPEEVNDYISSVADGPFTAKDFRTWLGTVTLVDRLRKDPPQDPDDRKAVWLDAVDEVAARLANTRSVARESYLPPGLEAFYLEGHFQDRIDALLERAEELSVPGRRNGEGLTLALLEELST